MFIYCPAFVFTVPEYCMIQAIKHWMHSNMARTAPWQQWWMLLDELLENKKIWVGMVNMHVQWLAVSFYQPNWQRMGFDSPISPIIHHRVHQLASLDKIFGLCDANKCSLQLRSVTRHSEWQSLYKGIHNFEFTFEFAKLSPLDSLPVCLPMNTH